MSKRSVAYRGCSTFGLQNLGVVIVQLLETHFLISCHGAWRGRDKREKVGWDAHVSVFKITVRRGEASQSRDAI